MPDTGAPWNIPYVAGTDLVADWPTDNQTMAEAIADALDDAYTVRQVLTTTLTSTFSTTSTTYTGVTGLDVTITPGSASSRIYITAMVPMVFNDAGTGQTSGMMTLYRDSTNLAVPTSPSSRIPAMVADQMDNISRDSEIMPVHHLAIMDSPATTSAITYSVQARVRTSSGTIYINRSSSDTDANSRPRGVATITAWELLP